MGFEQALLEELLLHLLDLDGLHPAAIGGELAVGLGAQGDQLVLWRGGEESGEELLFKDGEGAVEVFEVQGSSVRGSRPCLPGRRVRGGEWRLQRQRCWRAARDWWRLV